MKYRKVCFIGVIILALLMSLVFVSAYARTNYAGSLFGSLKPDIQSGDMFSGFNRSMCEAGQDFVLQINPYGCTPAVVRSDLLEEQNVPVFCPISATQINPLIDVEAIDYISIIGERPQEVISVGYFPGRAALGHFGFGQSLNHVNYPVLDNIGYAMITLRKNPNESSMPDYVQGNLTAKIRYDVENAFGVGKAVFYLPFLTAQEWEENFVRYEFWNGRGYLKAETVDDKGATISVYADRSYGGLQGGTKQRIARVNLDKGEKSHQIFMPGFDYCMGGMELRLEDIENPDTLVRLKINEQYFEIKEDEEFLDGKCRVSEIDKYGLVQQAEILCREDNQRSKFTLTLSPNINISLNGLPAKEYGLGEKLYEINQGEKSVYLAYIGTKNGLENKSKENLEVVLVAVPGEKQTLSKEELSSIKGFIERLDPGQISNIADLTLEAIKFYFSGGELFLRSLINGESFKFLKYAEAGENLFGEGNVLLIQGYTGAQNKELDDETQNYYEQSLEDYGIVIDDFSSEKYPEDNTETLGEEAFRKSIEIAEKLGQGEDILVLCSEFNEMYFEAVKPNICNNAYKNSNKEIAVQDVQINGKIYRLAFEAIEEPGFEDYGVVISVKDSKGSEIRSFDLTKDKLVYLKSDEESKEDLEQYSNEFIQLVEIRNKEEVRLRVNLDVGLRESAKDFTIGSTTNKVLRKDYPDSFGSERYVFVLEEVNLEKVAKVSVNPKINFAETTAEFPFKIGIDKRDIKLSPEKAQEKLEGVENTLETLEDIQGRIEPLVRGFKAGCLAVGSALTVKNFFTNLGGKGIARQKVMRSDGGWFDKCEAMVNAGEYSDVDKCLLENSDNVDEAVNEYSNAIEKVNEQIDALEEGITDENVLGEDVVDTAALRQRLINEEYKSEVLQNTGEKIKVSGESEPVEVSEILNMINENTTNINDARDLLLNSRLSNSDNSVVRDIAQSQSNSILASIYVNNKEAAVKRAVIEELNQRRGIQGIGSTTVRLEGTRTLAYEGGTTDSSGYGQISANTPIHHITYQNNEFFLVLEKIDSQYYRIKSVAATNGNLLPDDSDIVKEIKSNLAVKYFDEQTYQNKYENPQARYFETAPYQGLPAIIPFDIKNGWYVQVKSTLPVGGNIRVYDDSGRVSSFYLCNVGKNNKQEGIGVGDDDCGMINLGTGQLYNQFSGLKPNEAEVLVDKAVNAIDEASRQHSSGISSVRIAGNTIPVGEPYANIPGIQCQDFMSPGDCNLLFNACDPVVCPSSRCDLGGTFPVKDVVQSGIGGSLALCLPNFPDVKVPVCLTGINAGLEGWISVADSYKQCLQESINTGKTVGICDEIYSVHMCEFLWRQSIPIAKILLPKTFGKILGQDVRGGGEYLSVQNAFAQAGDSFNYFTQYYAANAYKAFKVRSVEEVASAEICQGFTSLIVPNSGDLFDNLISPDSPPQFYGRFDEIPFTTATNPPTSHYKVFYHIFAGKDSQAYYEVYLRGSGSSYYQDTAFRRIVARGFLGAGEYATSTEDFTAPSGYQEMCIIVNGQEECGFKEVSTSFAVDYINDKYVESQVTQTDINSESECISGTPSLYSLRNINPQSMAEEVIDPAIYNRGITRICATDNPGKGTDPDLGTKDARWKDVGYCGDIDVRCWLDTENVKDMIHSSSIEDETLKEFEERTLQGLKEENPNYIIDFDSFVQEFSSLNIAMEKIEKIDKSLDLVFFNNQKAYLYLLRGDVYSEIAIKERKEVKEEEKEKGDCSPDNLKFCITEGDCIWLGQGYWYDNSCHEEKEKVGEEEPEEDIVEEPEEELEEDVVEELGYSPKSCEDCGKGLTNICDLQECILIRNEIKEHCIFNDGILRNTCETPREFYPGSVSILPFITSSDSEFLFNAPERSNGATPEYIVLHHSASDSVERTVASLIKNRNSIHYIVNDEGNVYHVVPEELSAQHANCLNSLSIGIEIVNLGNGNDEYSLAQRRALENLLQYLIDRHGISQGHIVGHGCTNPRKKEDEPTGLDANFMYDINPVFPGGYSIKKRSLNNCPVGCEDGKPIEYEEPEQVGEEKAEEVSAELQCSSLSSCREVLGGQVMEIAEENEEPGFDEQVKADTGAKSFECLVLQVAYTESRVQHCSPIQENENPFYCENNFATILKSGAQDEESYGIMQINLKAHPGVDVTDFDTNVNFAINLLKQNYNPEAKLYECHKNSAGEFEKVTYSGWQRALRSYNGWNAPPNCDTGNTQYVDDVISVKQASTFQNLFPECV